MCWLSFLTTSRREPGNLPAASCAPSSGALGSCSALTMRIGGSPCPVDARRAGRREGPERAVPVADLVPVAEEGALERQRARRAVDRHAGRRADDVLGEVAAIVRARRAEPLEDRERAREPRIAVAQAGAVDDTGPGQLLELGRPDGAGGAQ